jgi:transposase
MGRTLVFVDRFYPSSKTCHNCGYVKNDLKLSDREWICPKCGTYHDRDVNAAVNILQEGERKIGGRTADFKPVENGPTCEVKSQTRAYSMKQEELQIE